MLHKENLEVSLILPPKNVDILSRKASINLLFPISY